MSALDELIYDRTQTDVTYAAELNRKLGRGEALTAQELADWNAGLKGAYNAADMNRVDAAVRELGGMLTEAGYPVQYVDPKQPEPEPEDEDIILTSADFQAGAYLYTTGVFRAGYANYVCTKSKIKLATGKSIVVRTDLTLLQYSGFVWYDVNKNFIANTFPSSSQGEAPIQWNGNFQAIPPENAVYCDIDINSSNITPATVGTVYVRQIANPESARLPEEYTQVEYIESDGTQYIDTGYKANQDTRVVFDAYILQTTTTATGLFGCRQAMGSNGFYIFEQNSDLGEYNDGYGSLFTRDIPLSALARHIIDKDKNKTCIDETIAHTYAAQTFTVPVTLTLFAVQQSNSVDERMSVCKLYSCVIYDNGTIVRYYIPCTNSSGIAGLYDTVSGVFFRDATSGSVEPVDLPTGYTQVEYIQSSGTQYIDTGYKPCGDTRTVCQFMPLDASKAYGIFGGRTSYKVKAYDIFARGIDIYFQDDYNNASTANIETIANMIYILDKNKNTSNLNGTTYSVEYNNFDVDYTMYLFGVNTSGSASAQLGALRIYYCTIYDNEVLVRHFVPCINASGIAGLYDTVNMQYYGNVGTGSFTTGDKVSKGFEPGTPVPEPTPPDENVWQIGDIVTQIEWAQYIANVQALRDAYYAMVNSPELPEPTAPLTYTGANAIEKLIYDIQQLYEGMIALYRICGTFTAGNSYQTQYIRRV